MSQASLPEVLPIAVPQELAALAAVAPPLPIADLFPPPLPKSAPKPRFSFGRFLAGILGWSWRWLAGAAMCFNLFVLTWFTSIVAVGWTNRVVQMVVLRCWWWRSDLRHRMTFAEFCETLGPNAPSPRPRWIVQNGLRASLRRPLRGGGKPDFVTLFGRMLFWPWYSLWLNFKLGIKATACTYAVLGLPCLLMTWSWEQGWINSFHGGYEQAPLGAVMGLIGSLLLFCVAMIYVPMAQAHQAATGEARAFFDFRFVKQLIGARITGYVLLALAIGFWSLMLNVARLPVISENFHANAAPTAEEGRLQFALYLFLLSLCMFPVYVLLRIFAGVIYQSAVLRLLRRGQVAQNELHPVLRRWVEALELNIVPRAETMGVTWLARLSARTAYLAVLIGVLYFVWFGFIVRFYVGFFLVGGPYVGMLNHPMIQVPCFDFMPAHLWMGQDM